MNRARIIRTSLAVVAALLATGSTAWAQLTPVVGPGATAFDPEIGVVNSGAVLDASAVVSADRRYVTITMQPQNASIIALRPFPVQGVAGGGFVGGAEPTGGDGAGAGGARGTPNRPTTPNGGAPGDGDGGFSAGDFAVRTNPTADELKDPAILNRRGMIRLRPS